MDDSAIYSLDEVLIDSKKFVCYSTVSNEREGIFLAYNYLKFYHSKDSIEKGKIFQNEKVFDNIEVKKMKANVPFFEEGVEDSFLFRKIDQSDLMKENIYLLRIKQNTAFYDSFRKTYGYEETYSGLFDNHAFVEGISIVENTLSCSTLLRRFAFGSFIFPLILYFFLIVFTYRIFLTTEIKYFVLRKTFYASKFTL